MEGPGSWEKADMFENLTEKLQRTFKNLRGQGKLTEEHLDAALAEIREALLEGDGRCWKATSMWASRTSCWRISGKRRLAAK